VHTNASPELCLLKTHLVASALILFQNNNVFCILYIELNKSGEGREQKVYVPRTDCCTFQVNTKWEKRRTEMAIASSSPDIFFNSKGNHEIFI